MGLMNYSPKHLRQPSSLSSSRNINVKQLLLHSSPSQQRLSHKHSISGTSSTTTLPRRRNLAFITSHGNSLPPPLALLPMFVATPTSDNRTFVTPQLVHIDLAFNLISSTSVLHGSSYDECSHLHLDSPTIKLASLELSDDPRRHRGSFGRMLSTLFLYGLETAELQELSTLNAYPSGPANVLNSSLFLYLDPVTSVLPIDINDYDLVINVAKESENLASQFNNDANGKKYVHLPWSHTLPISDDLPLLTELIADYEKRGKRILVHCQCGVLRLACVVVAYLMYKFKLSVNEAYELLKSGTENTQERCNREIAAKGDHIDSCPHICPNMGLIFKLMDFGERLNGGS